MQSERRHDIDALRALAFLLLIFYHIGMFYVSWDWHVKSNDIATWLEPLMLLVNQWRMPLIFVISGLAINFMLGDDGTRMPLHQFARQRAKRLGLPLLAGMLIVIPPQAYYEALSNQATEVGYLNFLWRYFTFQPFPEGAFAGSDNFVTWNHLWYLPYLLCYTLALVPLHWLLNRSPRLAAWRLWFQQRSGIYLVLVPVAWLMPIGLFIFPLSPGVRHNLIDDWYAHAMFGSFFLFGYLVGRSRDWWGQVVPLRWHLLGLAIISFIAFRGMLVISPDDPSLLQSAAQTFVVYLNRVTWILLVLAWGYRLLNRPRAWLAYANRAVFPWYIFHQTIIVVVGYELAQMALGPVVEPILVVGLTMAGCAVGFHLVDRFAPLHIWFGVRAAVESKPPPDLGAASTAHALKQNVRVDGAN